MAIVIQSAMGHIDHLIVTQMVAIMAMMIPGVVAVVVMIGDRDVILDRDLDLDLVLLSLPMGQVLLVPVRVPEIVFRRDRHGHRHRHQHHDHHCFVHGAPRFELFEMLCGMGRVYQSDPEPDTHPVPVGSTYRVRSDNAPTVTHRSWQFDDRPDRYCIPWAHPPTRFHCRQL
uniref:Uncharacterized protein n=1 Tax=Spongospora subterranea TaxID=70186 RepID=A0A0H5RE05_9EUKA|eukprot:CRZ11996.1 hypothetical protein [Spongospora subterranea]